MPTQSGHWHDCPLSACGPRSDGFTIPCLRQVAGALSRVEVKAVEALSLRADQPPQRAHFRATFGGVGAAPSGDYERAGEWVVRRSAFRILAMIMGRRAVSAVPANQA